MKIQNENIVFHEKKTTDIKVKAIH